MNTSLLAGDKFMSEMHLKQPGFTYSAFGLFTKNKERIEKFMQTGNTNFIYRNELDKACFGHDMGYGKSKDLAKRTQSDKVLRDKAFKIASNPKYDGSKSLVKGVLTLSQIINLQMSFIDRLLESLMDETFFYWLQTIFGVLI